MAPVTLNKGWYRMKSRLKGMGTLLSTAIVTCLVLLSYGVVPGWAGDTPGRVELDCKIVPANNSLNPWVVELKASSGELARMMSGLDGSTLHFKNLDPGIYNLCIVGLENRKHCESVDLTPPPGKDSFRFKKRLAEPRHELHSPDLNSVSRLKLEVPDNARDEMHRAEAAQLHGDMDQAIDHLKQAIKIYPDYTDALNNLGTYYHRQGKDDEAIAYFMQVTRLDPDFYGGWVNLAGSLIAVGEFQAALVASKHAFSIRPTDLQVLSQLALNYFYLHDFSQAKNYFLTVLNRDPASSVKPQLFLVHIALAERNKDDAARYIKEFLAVHPNSPQAAELKDTLANLESVLFTPPGLASPQQ